MYIEILKNQKEIIDSAIEKAKTYRNMAKELDIPKASISRYRNLGAIPEKRFRRIITFLKLKESELKIIKRENNWKQILGGKRGVKLKKEKGTFTKQLKKAQKSGARKLKEWHKKMKKEDPEKYYSLQYEKFKKIYGYKQITENNEKVRNLLEKEVADKLKELKIKYEYEPLIKVGKRWFFPDFLIDDKIIIECTAWEGKEKAYQLRDKIRYFNSKYKTFVVIPKHLYRKYKILDKHLILELDELARVAQLARAHGC